MTGERIFELAKLNCSYDQSLRTIDFARAIEREVLSQAVVAQPVDIFDVKPTLRKYKSSEASLREIVDAYYGLNGIGYSDRAEIVEEYFAAIIAQEQSPQAKAGDKS